MIYYNLNPSGINEGRRTIKPPDLPFSSNKIIGFMDGQSKVHPTGGYQYLNMINSRYRLRSTGLWENE